MKEGARAASVQNCRYKYTFQALCQRNQRIIGGPE